MVVKCESVFAFLFSDGFGGFQDRSSLGFRLRVVRGLKFKGLKI